MIVADTASPRYTIGVSTKMYFTYSRTIAWAEELAALARRHPAVVNGLVELFVVPTYPSLVRVREALAGTPVRLGAQDVASADAGAYTGEVSAVELAEIGCTLTEIGHAERRRLFHEDDAAVASKTEAALRNGVTPLLCVGELVESSAETAAAEVVGQLDAALAGAAERGLTGPLLVAYEPAWAIGASAPASVTHIRAVVAALETHLAALSSHPTSRVIYGGSAGPGLLTDLAGEVRGLFLGRFAHEPTALELILDEALSLSGQQQEAS